MFNRKFTRKNHLSQFLTSKVPFEDNKTEIITKENFLKLLDNKEEKTIASTLSMLPKI